MAKFIRLYADKPLDPNGFPSYWFVLPTANLREIVTRRLLERDSRMNYVLWWKDTNGFGMEVAHVKWVPEGQVYGWRGERQR